MAMFDAAARFSLQVALEVELGVAQQRLVPSELSLRLRELHEGVAGL